VLWIARASDSTATRRLLNRTSKENVYS
jgi:hypothetical protein